MNLACDQVAADPPRLDIDDGRGPEAQRRVGGVSREDRFIEADRRRAGLAEEHVAIPVLLVQRLLDEDEVEWVEEREMRRMAARVCLVRVDLERDGRPGCPHRRDRLEIPARLDLQLDPAVAGIDVRPNLFEQGINALGRRDADRDTAVDDVARSAEVGTERLTARPEPGIEEGCRQGVLGHRVAAHDIEGLTNGNRVGPLRQLAQRRHEVPLDNVDRAVGVLGRVSGPRHCHAFAPPMDAIGAHCLDEHEIAHALGAEARPEGPHEGDVESVEAQQVDGHGRCLSRT